MRSNSGLTSRRWVPSRTSRTNETAKRGSIPEVAFAIIDIVPVGAMVVTVALRVALIFPFHVLCSKFGKLPRSCASVLLALRASSFKNLASLSVNVSAWGAS